MAKLLELVVILLLWLFDTPSKVYAQASATPACPNTSPLPLVSLLILTHFETLIVAT